MYIALTIYHKIGIKIGYLFLTINIFILSRIFVRITLKDYTDGRIYTEDVGLSLLL
jgi:hypothetical protein